MNFIPIDTANTQPQAGGLGLPEGWYVLQVQDATEVRPEQNGQYTRRAYKTKVAMGPGASQELVGRPFTDWIREDAQWAGRHMELFVACLGSIDAVRQVGAQYQNRLPPEILAGKYYIAQLVKSDKYTNVLVRLPYTQEHWNANVSNGAQQVQPQAPAGILTQPQPQQFAQPQQFGMPQQFAQPSMPGMPQMGMPSNIPAPSMPMGIPTPPPPPGLPSIPR